LLSFLTSTTLSLESVRLTISLPGLMPDPSANYSELARTCTDLYEL